MKTKKNRKKQKSIAARKTEDGQKKQRPYKAVSLGLLLWLLTTWLFFGSGIVRHTEQAKGQRATSTIVASVDFDCENLRETAFRQDKAAAAVPPVFTIDPAKQERALKVIGELFRRLNKLSSEPPDQRKITRDSIADLLIGSTVNAQELIDTFPAGIAAGASANISSNLVRVMSAGILSDEYRRSLFHDSSTRELTIRNGKQERTVRQQSTYSVSQAIREIASRLPSATQRDLVRHLLANIVTDNMTYDEAATEALRKAAIQAVPPVIQQHLAGSTIIRAGEPITDQTLLMLQCHEKKRKQEQEVVEQILEIFGNSMLLLAGLIVAAAFLCVVAPETVRRPDHLLLLSILSLFTLGSARLLAHFSLYHALVPPAFLVYLVPQALAILLAAILLGGSAALCLGLWTSFATAIFFDHSFGVLVLGILIAITATSATRHVHRRASLFQAGLWVCAVKAIFVLVSAILNRPEIHELAGQLAAAISSGMVATILALLLIPLFERMFKITTDITLLELSDMSNPLLRKLAEQAPGTYHHSLMVAAIGQSAAEAIGANALLVRVCAYYHDIGKLAKPEFFTENIQQAENPHDELSPNMSALIIISHVKEGLALARRNKLPQPILDAIEQHHGNGLISYFYHKAKTLQQKESPDGREPEPINDADFRYGGAPAVSAEMAILSLADATEAASRSIEKPTPQKISNLVSEILAAKMRDGQLDHAQLTLAQLNTIRHSFIFSLTNMLHGRIPYPKDHEDNARKPTAGPSPANGKNPAAD